MAIFYNCEYQVVLHGNMVVMSNSSKEVCLKKCLSYLKRGEYVELWYTRFDGKRNLVDYWN